jgi:beta-glucanase (GH16 family)
VVLSLALAACSPEVTTVTDSGLPATSLNKGKGGGGSTPPPPPPPPPSPTYPLGVQDFNLTVEEMRAGGWTLAFQEEFTATDLSLWSVWHGGAWNNELQLYRNDPANLSVSGGVVTITARREAVPVTGPANPYDSAPKSFGFTSARLESFRHFSASRTTPSVRMAARIRLPAGHGIWPAFWSYGDPWPTQGEIDILEMRGDVPTYYETAYWYGRRSGVNLVSTPATVIGPTVDLTGGFHVYEMIWTSDALSFYFDGILVDVKTGGYVPSMYGKSQRLVLNVAVGGDFFPTLDVTRIPDSAVMTVDWVRVFTK